MEIYFNKLTTPKDLRIYFYNRIQKLLSYFKSTTSQQDKKEQTEEENEKDKPIKINIFDNQYLSEGGRHIDYLVVPLNQRVVWENLDAAYHTVTHLQNRNFNSGNLKLNDLYEFRFDQPGRYWIYCRLHPQNMIHINVLNANGKSVPFTYDQDYALEQPFKTIPPPKTISNSCDKENDDYEIRPYPLLEKYPPIKLDDTLRMRFTSGR
jgi:hypothetical protein